MHYFWMCLVKLDLIIRLDINTPMALEKVSNLYPAINERKQPTIDNLRMRIQSIGANTVFLKSIWVPCQRILKLTDFRLACFFLRPWHAVGLCVDVPKLDCVRFECTFWITMQLKSNTSKVNVWVCLYIYIYDIIKKHVEYSILNESQLLDWWCLFLTSFLHKTNNWKPSSSSNIIHPAVIKVSASKIPVLPSYPTHGLNNVAPASGTGDHIDPWGTQELLVSQAPEPIQAGVSEKLVIGGALICLMLAAFVFQRVI